MQPQTTRRAVMAGLAAAPIAGLPAFADGVSSDDPIFAAIERHRAALARHNECCRLTDEVAARQEGRAITDDDRAAYEAAAEAEEAAVRELALMPPTTVGGLVAELQYFKTLDEPETFFGEFIDALVASPLLNGEALS